MKRSGPLRSQSRKRARQATARRKVREEVLARAGGRCAALDALPGHVCTFYPWADPPRAGLEVDELSGGSARAAEWLDPDRCQALCPGAHDWKTTHPEAAEAAGLYERTDHRPTR